MNKLQMRGALGEIITVKKTGDGTVVLRVMPSEGDDGESVELSVFKCRLLMAILVHLSGSDFVTALKTDMIISNQVDLGTIIIVN